MRSAGGAGRLVHIARCQLVIEGGRHDERGETLDVIVAIAVSLHASAPRSSAQTPNVVIQWNQTLQTQFSEQGRAFTFARFR